VDLSYTQALFAAGALALVGLWLVWTLVIKPTIKLALYAAVLAAAGIAYVIFVS